MHPSSSDASNMAADRAGAGIGSELGNRMSRGWSPIALCGTYHNSSFGLRRRMASSGEERFAFMRANPPQTGAVLRHQWRNPSRAAGPDPERGRV